MRPRALILHADGTNRDVEAAIAFELAGADPDIVPLNLLRTNGRPWSDFQILALPGGFSYGDTLGAGRLLAVDLQVYFADQVGAFISAGKPVIGICNGFQALIRVGLLPGLDRKPVPEGRDKGMRDATLTFNAAGRFECRWVTLKPQSQTCLWTRGLELIECPVAHGEGKFVLRDPALLDPLRANHQIALVYATEYGAPAGGAYPFNPNGSIADIAGVCNPQGNVLGLMPHPEDHVVPYQHPRWTRQRRQARGPEPDRMGLKVFQNGVQYAAQC